MVSITCMSECAKVLTSVFREKTEGYGEVGYHTINYGIWARAKVGNTKILMRYNGC